METALICSPTGIPEGHDHFGPALWSCIFEFLPKKDISARYLGAACKAWLKAHDECAWTDFVVVSGRPVYMDSTSRNKFADCYSDSELKTEPAFVEHAHTTVSMLLKAPLKLKCRIAASTRRLTFLVAQPEQLAAFAQDFCRLCVGVQSLEIHTPFFRPGPRVQQRPLDVFFGKLLRQSGFLKQLNTFIWNDEIDGWCSGWLMDEVITSMIQLRTLDVPWLDMVEGGMSKELALAPCLEYCQGIRIETESEGFIMPPLPHLRSLSTPCLTMENPQDFEELLSSFGNLFPRLRALKLWLCCMPLTRQALQALPTCLNKLVLLLDEVEIEGLTPTQSCPESHTQALAVCDHIQAWIPDGCALVVRAGLITGIITKLEDEENSVGEGEDDEAENDESSEDGE